MRRKAIVLVLTMAATLVLASGVALAVNKVCLSGTTATNPCKGTAKTKTSSGNDILMGTSGPDYITALSGNDLITGAGGNDTTDGSSGNDTYSYRDAWGTDTLRDSAGIDALNLSATTTGVDIRMVPQWTNYNRVVSTGGSDLVTMGTSVVEKATGGWGSDALYGGPAVNTLSPGGGGVDTLWDYGGFTGQEGFAPVPPSNDTYKGFASNTALDQVMDFGGTSDTVDLKPFVSTEVYFEAVDFDGVSNTQESLLLLTGNNSGVVILGQFSDYNGTFGDQGSRIERLVFADGTFPGPVQEVQVQSLNEASALDATEKETRAKAVKKLIAEAKRTEGKGPKLPGQQ